MAILSLGVNDFAYSQAESNGMSQRTTTGEVATILERNYHVMATFFALRQQKIADYLTEAAWRAHCRIA